MKTKTFGAYGELPGGSRVRLTGEQAAAREHLITAEDAKALEADRRAVSDAKTALAAARKSDRGKDVTAAEAQLSKAREALAKPRIYIAKAPLGFKAGEEVAVDEATADQASRVALETNADVRKAGFEEGRAQGRKDMLAEVMARNDALDRVDEAEKALAAAKDAAAKTAAQGELDAANAALKALPELVA